jgi:hypothetical protein
MSPNDTPLNLIQHVLNILSKTELLIKLRTFEIGNRLCVRQREAASHSCSGSRKFYVKGSHTARDPFFVEVLRIEGKNQLIELNSPAWKNHHDFELNLVPAASRHASNRLFVI